MGKPMAEFNSWCLNGYVGVFYVLFSESKLTRSLRKINLTKKDSGINITWE